MTLEKDPDAVLDYTHQWTPWLAGDTIATSTWTVGAGSLVINSSTHDDTTATVWLSGGDAGTGFGGKTNTVVNHITTTGGRTDERTLRLTVKNL